MQCPAVNSPAIKSPFMNPSFASHSPMAAQSEHSGALSKHSPPGNLISRRAFGSLHSPHVLLHEALMFLISSSGPLGSCWVPTKRPVPHQPASRNPSHISSGSSSTQSPLAFIAIMSTLQGRPSIIPSCAQHLKTVNSLQTSAQMASRKSCSDANLVLFHSNIVACSPRELKTRGLLKDHTVKASTSLSCEKQLQILHIHHVALASSGWLHRCSKRCNTDSSAPAKLEEVAPGYTGSS
mmetsp:Transcript_22624/g.43211  ORF Transcript_22624/g.43211 Transcript_22624/m.43211 type:complete len:238 (-) Transcript_22624:329-1042(-)